MNLSSITDHKRLNHFEWLNRIGERHGNKDVEVNVKTKDERSRVGGGGEQTSETKGQLRQRMKRVSEMMRMK